MRRQQQQGHRIEGRGFLTSCLVSCLLATAATAPVSLSLSLCHYDLSGRLVSRICTRTTRVPPPPAPPPPPSPTRCTTTKCHAPGIDRYTRLCVYVRARACLFARLLAFKVFVVYFTVSILFYDDFGVDLWVVPEEVGRRGGGGYSIFLTSLTTRVRCEYVMSVRMAVDKTFNICFFLANM